MATVTRNRARVARTISGNSPQVLKLPEAASQTFKKGELVYLNGGYVTEIGANPSLILGMADEDGHNGATDGLYNVFVVIANMDTIFEVHKTNSTGVGSVVTAVTDVGKEFAIYRDTTNSWFTAYDGEGANSRLICLDHSNFDKVGDVYGRLLVQVLGANRQLFCTS
jgi:hypothetical protein